MKKLLYSLSIFALIGVFSSCSDDCENISCVNGECVDGTCECDAGWTGSDCSTVASGSTISGFILNDVTLTGDAVYKLSGKVVVQSGATLTIGAGAIIKAEEGNETNATALIVARGGKIMAQGTAEKPIIFTSVLDNIEVGQIAGANLDENDRSKWGGLIILGYAPISAGDGDTEANIEGLPATEGYGKYGGSDENDNSGTLTYVSVRHGGVLIGEGNEINGITLGGVGAGTIINHVEVVGNLDDGIECFGGTVDIHNAIVVYQGDDAIDLDQNYKGTFDNFLVIHGGDTGDGLEIDGPEGTTYTDGKFSLMNGTIISDYNNGRGATFKSKAQGTVTNVSFEAYPSSSKFIRVRESFDEDNACADKTDALDNFYNGDLTFSGVQLIASGLTVENCVNVYTDNTTCEANLDEATFDAAMTGVSIVSGATVGATESEFRNWTWADAKSKF